MDPIVMATADLSADRIIMITENVTVELANTVCNMLIYHQSLSPTEPIKIYINSNGGDVNGLINLYDVMQTISCPIYTVCLGKAFSAGAWLLALGEKGKRFAMKNSKVMIHGLQLGFPVMPDLTEVSSTNYISYCDKVNQKILKILASHSNHSYEKVKTDCEKDVWLTAEEALKYGLVDKLI